MGVEMPERSNLAIDLAELCQRLAHPSELSGGVFLAGHFEVEPYSPAFFEILAVITAATCQLESALVASELHPSAVPITKAHLQAVRAAFNSAGLAGNWSNHGAPSLAASHSDPILTLSGALALMDYNKPSSEEVASIIADANELLGWLEEHEIEESDFIRLCIIDGLKRFIFRMEKIGWLGWPHAVECLQEIIGAYLAIERGFDPELHPKTGALMRKVLVKLRQSFELVTGTREAADNVTFAISVLKGVIYPGAGYIAGYLN